jgi:hypothetical protein
MINYESLGIYIFVILGFIITLKLLEFLVGVIYLRNYSISNKYQIENLVKTKMIDFDNIKLFQFEEFRNANIYLRIGTYLPSILCFGMLNSIFNKHFYNHYSSFCIIILLGSISGIEKGIFKINRAFKWRLELCRLRVQEEKYKNTPFFKDKIILLEAQLLVDMVI